MASSTTCLPKSNLNEFDVEMSGELYVFEYRFETILCSSSIPSFSSLSSSSSFCPYVTHRDILKQTLSTSMLDDGELSISGFGINLIYQNTT
ncbi:hypothetical protein BLOT_001363, partial [Blomia tropicalis]